MRSPSRARSAERGSARPHGERDAAALVREARRALEEAGARIDYVEIVDPAIGRPVTEAAPGSRMLLAAFLGATRLIDNCELP